MGTHAMKYIWWNLKQNKVILANSEQATREISARGGFLGKFIAVTLNNVETLIFNVKQTTGILVSKQR